MVDNEDLEADGSFEILLLHELTLHNAVDETVAGIVEVDNFSETSLRGWPLEEEAKLVNTVEKGDSLEVSVIG